MGRMQFLFGHQSLWGNLRCGKCGAAKKLLVLGFENTVHHLELWVEKYVYPAQEYRKMTLVIKSILRNPEMIQKLLVA